MKDKKKKIQNRREVKGVQDGGQGKTLGDTTGSRGWVQIRAHQKAREEHFQEDDVNECTERQWRELAER